MFTFPAALVLLVAQTSAPPPMDQQLIDRMNKAVVKNDCETLNAAWREARKSSPGASPAFKAALDNLHAQRSTLGCLKGCKDLLDQADCPKVESLDARWLAYQAMQARLKMCLDKGPCSDREVDELQGALRPTVLVILSEIKPQDRRWSTLVSGFSTVVGLDTSGGVLLAALSRLTPEQRGALDPKKLSHALGLLIGGLPPNMIETEDLKLVLDFAASVLGSEKGPKGIESLDRLRREWSVVLAIMDKTRSPAMRIAIDSTLDILINRYAEREPTKAAKYRNLKTDLTSNSSLDGAMKVARALDLADLEEAQRLAERSRLFPIIIAEYREKRLYTTMDLPLECPADVRPKNRLCDAVYQIADQFFLILDGRALSGTTPLASAPLDEWISGAERALRNDRNPPKDFTGQFAGGVGLQIQALSGDGSKLAVRVAFIIQALGGDTKLLEKGEEVRKDVSVDRVIDVGKELAVAVLKRSTLLKAFDRSYFNPPSPHGVSPVLPTTNQTTQEPGVIGMKGAEQATVAKQPLEFEPRQPSAAWALLSAGAPLIGDQSPGKSWTGIALSAADTLALVGAAAFLLDAKSRRDDYANGTASSLAPADRQYGRAIGLLITAGVIKVAGLITSACLHYKKN